MRSQVPSYRQLAEKIRSAIESGDYGPDEAIPSLRELQQRSGLAMATVQHAVRVLVADGLVVSVPGRGTFVKGKG